MGILYLTLYSGNFFLLPNFIPALFNILYPFIFFDFPDGIFLFMKCIGTSKFPFRALVIVQKFNYVINIDPFEIYRSNRDLRRFLREKREKKLSVAVDLN
jgi:hypothetical protein